MPSVKYCAVPSCVNNSYKKSDQKFYSFPRDCNRQKLWVHMIGRVDINIERDVSKNYNICDVHFHPLMVENGRLKQYALPIIRVSSSNVPYKHTFGTQTDHLYSTCSAQTDDVQLRDKYVQTGFIELLETETNITRKQKLSEFKEEMLLEIKIEKLEVNQNELPSIESTIETSEKYFKPIKLEQIVNENVISQFEENNILLSEYDGSRTLENAGEGTSFISEEFERQPVPKVCDKCDKTFTSSELLEKHKIVHSEIKPYACYTCRVGFTRIKDLDKHLKTQACNIFICDICNDKFTLKDDLTNHIKIHGEVACTRDATLQDNGVTYSLEQRCIKIEESTEVAICDVFTHNNNRMYPNNIQTTYVHDNDVTNHSLEQRNMETVKSTETAQNKDIYHNITRDASLVNDVINHSLEQINIESVKSTEIAFCDVSAHSIIRVYRNKCDKCDRSFSRKKDLKCHRREHRKITPRRLYKCEQCDESFTRKIDLINHTENIKTTVEKKEKEEYLCDMCDEIFSKSDDLEIHRAVHTVGKFYKCDTCGKLLQRASLKKHMRMHKEVNMFKCRKCDMKLTTLKNLKNHIEKHTRDLPFKCDICDTSYKRKFSLKIHMLAHMGGKPYECDKCDGNFAQRNCLVWHMKTHTADKPFKCDTCIASFNGISFLNKHKMIHEGDKPIKCDKCDSSFERDNSLRHHMIVHDTPM